MPYIQQKDRLSLTDLLQQIGMWHPASVGELNFVLTTVAHRHAEVQGNSYSTHNAVVGALECAKQEYYRRVVVPYETDKIAQNGDVMPDFTK